MLSKVQKAKVNNGFAEGENKNSVTESQRCFGSCVQHIEYY